MSFDQEIVVNPELSSEFRSFEEFCDENSGSEGIYLDLIAKNPTVMDAVTLAFCMRHLVKLSQEFMTKAFASIKNDNIADLRELLDTKGIQLDKKHSDKLRKIVFAFRDTDDDQIKSELARAFTLIAFTRARKNLVLNIGESYRPPDEGWIDEDFDGNESAFEMVRAIEDPHWSGDEEI
ncbi:MAG: hypothetical protein AB7V04_11510 [Desulfomonilaceae bacterium]